jgi:hypothetical protein
MANGTVRYGTVQYRIIPVPYVQYLRAQVFKQFSVYLYYDDKDYCYVDNKRGQVEKLCNVPVRYGTVPVQLYL